MSITALFVFSVLLDKAWAAAEVEIGMMFEEKISASPIEKFYLIPASQIAMDAVERRLETGDFKNFDVSYVSDDSCCTRPDRSTGAVASSFLSAGVDVFLGPALTSGMRIVADMAADWNLPVISGGSTSVVLDDKTRYATLTRTGPCMRTLIKFLSAVFQRFGWQRCAILRDLPGGHTYYNKILPEPIYQALLANGIEVTQVYFSEFENLDETLHTAASAANIVFLNASPVRDILVLAHRLGYADGSHVFLYWYPSEFAPWQTSRQFENLDAEDAEAMKALMIMRIQVPDISEYHEFQAELQRRQDAMYGIVEMEENLYAAATHDAVLMYAQVINETVAEGGDVRDGRAITQKMWNRKFQGVSGEIHIGENGDRYWVCELLKMTDGSFSVHGTYDEATDTLTMSD